MLPSSAAPRSAKAFLERPAAVLVVLVLLLCGFVALFVADVSPHAPPISQSAATPAVVLRGEAKHLSAPADDLLPTTEVIAHGRFHTEVLWKFVAEGARERGLMLLFHGCSHRGKDWFVLPEERAVVRAHLRAGYSVLAFSSQDAQSGCWVGSWPADRKNPGGNKDIDSVLGALALWLKRHGKEHVPLLAMGASSGGSFVTILARAMHLHAAVVIVSPGHPAALRAPPAKTDTEERQGITARAAAGTGPQLDSSLLKNERTLFNLPPLLFIYEEGDTQWASAAAIARSVQLVRSTFPHIAAVDPVPLVHSLSVAPLALDADTLLAIDAIRTETPQCAPLFFQIAQAAADTQGPLLSPEGLQLRDPRRGQLLQVVQTRMRTMSSDASSSATDRSSAARCKLVLSRHFASVQELLQERFAQHEMTSRKVEEQIQWTQAVMEHTE